MKTPKGTGQLYDVLHEWFGFGNWDDTREVANPAWFQARRVEIAKLETLIRSRGTSVGQMFIAAQYCRAHHIPVKAPAGLLLHMGDALREHRFDLAEAKRAQIEHEIAAAIDFERTTHPGEDRWLSQLLRAQGDARKEVLHRWKLGRRQFKST